MNPEELLSTWAELGEAPRSALGIQRIRIDTEAAADIFACIFWPSQRPGLLIEGAGVYTAGSVHIPTCRGVRMIHEDMPEPYPRTSVRIMLEDERLLDIFAVMSADLINVISSQQSASQALERCVDRLCKWQILFETVRVGGLSEEAQRGMLGELLVMETLLLPVLGLSDTVEAWVGPNAAHQDFIVAGLAIEVKTSVAKRHARIMIANEKQLDERPHKSLFLAYLQLDESVAHGDSLAIVVSRLRSLVAQDAAAAHLLDDRLLLGGYLDVHAPLYDLNRWRCSSTRYYRVGGDFPRLTDANLPDGVGDIRYSIIADNLGAYETPQQNVSLLLGAANG